jgi:hypothetical protein
MVKIRERSNLGEIHDSIIFEVLKEYAAKNEIFGV